MPFVTSVLLAMSQALTNLAVPTGSNWTAQVFGIGDDDHRRRGLRLDQRRVRGVGDPVRPGEVEDQREEHPADHHELAPDAVAQPPEEHVERRADDGHDDEQQVLGLGRHAERLFEEDLKIEEGEIPYGALRAHDSEEGDEDLSEAAPLSEGFAERCFRYLTLLPQLREMRALGQLGAHPYRDREQDR